MHLKLQYLLFFEKIDISYLFFFWQYRKVDLELRWTTCSPDFGPAFNCPLFDIDATNKYCLQYQVIYRRSKMVNS